MSIGILYLICSFWIAPFFFISSHFNCILY
nr:MAG TPA: hypothetical protein [Caudoviricetes sp.]